MEEGVEAPTQVYLVFKDNERWALPLGVEHRLGRLTETISSLCGRDIPVLRMGPGCKDHEGIRGPNGAPLLSDPKVREKL